MKFYENQMFHIFNRGNNQRKIFFTNDNYEFFLWKMRGYLLPFGDLVAWCLMPNHFHWQFFVKKVKTNRKEFFEHVDEIEFNRRISKYGKKARPVNRDWSRDKKAKEEIGLNEAIAILQRSYGRAINKEKGWTGRLFNDNCQAKDGWLDEFITVQKNGKDDFRFGLNNNYGYQCLCYIHNNPVIAKMVKKAEDYHWSSARDYAGLRDGDLCNLEIGRNLINFM